MIKLTLEQRDEIFEQYCTHRQLIGYFSDYGAGIGNDTEWVLIDTKDLVALAHISELEQDGLFVKLKK